MATIRAGSVCRSALASVKVSTWSPSQPLAARPAIANTSTTPSPAATFGSADATPGRSRSESPARQTIRASSSAITSPIASPASSSRPSSARWEAVSSSVVRSSRRKATISPGSAPTTTIPLRHATRRRSGPSATSTATAITITAMPPRE